MVTRCSWCRKTLADNGVADGKVSDGICPECAFAYFGFTKDDLRDTASPASQEPTPPQDSNETDAPPAP